MTSGGLQLFQPVLLGGVEEDAEALDLVEDLGAGLRRRLEQVIEDIGHDAAGNQRQRCRQRDHAGEDMTSMKTRPPAKGSEKIVVKIALKKLPMREPGP